MEKAVTSLIETMVMGLIGTFSLFVSIVGIIAAFYLLKFLVSSIRTRYRFLSAGVKNFIKGFSLFLLLSLFFGPMIAIFMIMGLVIITLMMINQRTEP